MTALSHLFEAVFVFIVVVGVIAGDPYCDESIRVDEGDNPIIFLTRDGATMHLVYFKTDEFQHQVLFHRKKNVADANWTDARMIANFSSCNSADIIGNDTFVHPENTHCL